MTVEEQEKIVLAYRVSGKTMKVWTAENGSSRTVADKATAICPDN